MVAANSQGPLDWKVPITNQDGTPTPEFMRKWAQQRTVNGLIPDLSTAAKVSAVIDLLGSVAGDILIRTPSGWVGLPIGTTAQELTVVAGLPAWTDKQFRAMGGTPGRKPAASEELFNALMKTGDHLPVGLTGSLLKCEVAPTANWTMTLKRNGSSIGTGTILASATVGSFTFASAITFTDLDLFTGTAPASADTTLSGVSYSLLGTRTL